MQFPFKRVHLLFVFLSCSYLSFSANIIVVNTNGTGVGSFRQAINDAITGDSISFDPNLLIAGSDSIVLDSSLFITKNLYIHGLYNTNDTLYISGGNSTNIIRASYISKIEIDSMVFINANGSFIWGGGLDFYNVDSIIIQNCTNGPSGSWWDKNTLDWCILLR